MQGEVHFIPSHFNSAVPKKKDSITGDFLAKALQEWCIRYLDDCLPPEPTSTTEKYKRKKFGTFFRVTAKPEQMSDLTSFEEIAEEYFELLAKSKEKVRKDALNGVLGKGKVNGEGKLAEGLVEPWGLAEMPGEFKYQDFRIKVADFFKYQDLFRIKLGIPKV